MLRIIARNNQLQCVPCLRDTLNKWLELNTDDATWKTLEVALTNVNRAKLGLDPVDDVYGKDVYHIGMHVNAILECFVYSVYNDKLQLIVMPTNVHTSESEMKARRVEGVAIYCYSCNL